MIGKKSYFKEKIVVLKMYKISYRILYLDLNTSVKTWKLEGIQK